ncbi:MAG: hypothetical protein M3342_09845 [Bacteroidota bacterium]|nr:hypothetical protein [Bacteroidota bacterium]
MDAVIKLKPEELDYNLVNKIKELIAGRTDIEVTISLKESTPEYLNDLDRFIEQLKNNDTVTFTLEEFLAYPNPGSV